MLSDQMEAARLRDKLCEQDTIIKALSEKCKRLEYEVAALDAALAGNRKRGEREIVELRTKIAAVVGLQEFRLEPGMVAVPVNAGAGDGYQGEAGGGGGGAGDAGICRSCVCSGGNSGSAG